MRKFYTSVLALFLGLCLGFTVNGQSISGTVIDETNLPLPQVSVLVKGTSNGTATDFDGRYTITGLEAGENHSLTMWDATSSELTLNLMTGVAFIMVPVILAYTIWTYYKMFGRLDSKFIEDNKNSLY